MDWQDSRLHNCPLIPYILCVTASPDMQDNTIIFLHINGCLKQISQKLNVHEHVFLKSKVHLCAVLNTLHVHIYSNICKCAPNICDLTCLLGSAYCQTIFKEVTNLTIFFISNESITF